MNPGDLVRVFNVWFYPGESDLAIFAGDQGSIPELWGEYFEPATVNCTILWNGRIVPFSRDNLVIVGEHEGG